MRILLLSTYFRPDIASNGVIMSKLADEFVARGNEVTVLTSVPHYDINRVWPEYSGRMICRERSGSMQIYRLFIYVASDKANVAQRILSYGSFSLLSFMCGATLPRHDVILIPSPPLSNGVIGDIVGRLRNVPFVYNVQDIWPDVAIRAGVLKNEKTIQRLKRMEAYVYRRAAGVAVVSNGFRSNLLEKGVRDEKISVIPNFIDTDFITPQSKLNSFSIKYNIENKFVVLFAGNMGFSQGLESVLDAAKLLKGYSDIEFLMVGNGASRDRAQAYLSELELNNVRFLPYQPQEELSTMYGAADVCLIPLRRGFTAESVPSKLLAIMAASRPSIASVDVGSETCNILRRTGSGICVEPENPTALADAILSYYRDPNARMAAGESGRRCVEREFRCSDIADKYLDAMKAAIDRRRRGVPRGTSAAGEDVFMETGSRT